MRCEIPACPRKPLSRDLTIVQVFAGPISESIPTSNASFAHRRSRASSTASFRYFETPVDRQAWQDTEAISDESEDEQGRPDESNLDLEYGRVSPSLRKSSSFSCTSTQDPLLLRRTSTVTNGAAHGQLGRVNQKMYIMTEDLTIMVAGFRNTSIGLLAYALICFCSIGIGYLLLRWLPYWRVKLVGTPCPLRDCSWVAIEVRLPLPVLHRNPLTVMLEPMGRVHGPRGPQEAVR